MESNHRSKLRRIVYFPLYDERNIKQDAYFSINSWIFKFAERILNLGWTRESNPA